MNRCRKMNQPLFCMMALACASTACGELPGGAPDTAGTQAAIAPLRLQDVPGLDFAASADAYYQIQDYGDALRNNKNYLVAVLQGQQATLAEQVLVVAMAMQETNHMDPSERDASKDGTPSANISILNLNIDMLNMAGYDGQDNGWSMNNPQMLGKPVWLLRHAIDTWGLARTLNFQRGGRTAFEDGVSYGALDYRRSIATIYQAIANDISLLSDGRRVAIDLDHVF